jgi:hypothetical protein
MGERWSYQTPITSELLPPSVRGTDYATKLENLKLTPRTAYKTVRENYRSHLTNKRYFDQKSKERIF